MNISYNWLKNYLSHDISIEALSQILTGCGLEVESIEHFESVKGGLKGLVVGEVLETSRHPNADRLTITKVNVGNETPAQIVCGAPNVAAGQKVVVALPGTTLYPLTGEPFEIKKSKIRGEASEGMICAEDEVGLGQSHDGIMVLTAEAIPGTPAINYFNVETDHIFSIGLTPNRSDAASHFGVARDVRAVINTKAGKEEMKIVFPDISSFSSGKNPHQVTVSVEHEACIRYSGIHLTNVKVAESPQWLKNRLRAIGLKPVNNIVDITNFVLFETGQPLHAFDATKIKGKKVIVKSLPAGSGFVTLDGVNRKLSGTELMICDADGGMCIAGVFGGVASGVSNETTEVFLESACFDAVAVRKASKFHGLKTDASFRFERGSDPEMTLPALKRAAMLIAEIAGGQPVSETIDVYPRPLQPVVLDFDTRNFVRLTGVTADAATLSRILSWLDIEVLKQSGEILQLRVPLYRVDVTREADVIEEILRIIGYDNIPLPEKLNTSLPSMSQPPLENIRSASAGYLVANGFFEVMSNSLTRSTLPGGDAPGVARIRNPLSVELDILRFDMLFPLLDIARYNKNRKRPDLKVFEFGKTYVKGSEGYFETNHLALLITGNRTPAHWQSSKSSYSVYYLKSILNNIISAIKVSSAKLKWEFPESENLGQVIELKSGKKVLATAGCVKSGLLKSFDLDGEVWYADVNLDHCVQALGTAFPQISEPPKFPEVRRDLSMLVDHNLQYQSLESMAFETERKLLREVNLFDFYEGDKIGAGKKSYAMSFILRDDEKTLTDKEIDKAMQRIMDNFEQKLGVVIRKG